MSRKATLEQKRVALTNELRQWARKENLLRPGEFLYCSLVIGRAGDVVISSGVPNRVISEKSRPAFNLSTEDWTELLSFAWPDQRHQKLIQFLESRKNKPMRREETQKELGFEWTYGFGKSISCAICRCGSRGTYSIIECDGKYVPYLQRRVRIRKR